MSKFPVVRVIWWRQWDLWVYTNHWNVKIPKILNQWKVIISYRVELDETRSSSEVQNNLFESSKIATSLLKHRPSVLLVHCLFCWVFWGLIGGWFVCIVHMSMQLHIATNKLHIFGLPTTIKYLCSLLSLFFHARSLMVFWLSLCFPLKV